MWGLFRLFLALTVVVFHARIVSGISHQFFGPGDMAVEVFYTISGFVITMTIRRNYSDGAAGFARFWGNRALRLLPPYWIALVVALVVVNAGLGSEAQMRMPTGFAWLSALFLIGQTGLFDHIRGAAQPLIVAWTISIELFYYFVLSVGAARSRKAATIFLAISVATASTFLIATAHASTFFATFLMYCGTIWQCLPFAAGCYLAWIETPPRLNQWLAYAAVIAGACYVWLMPQTDLTFYLCVPFAVAAIIGCESLQQTRLTRFLADLSYPVYLVQFPVMALLRGLHGWAFVIAAPFAVLSAAIVINRLVEAPIAKIRARVRASKSLLAFTMGPEPAQPMNHPSTGPDVIAVPGADP